MELSPEVLAQLAKLSTDLAHNAKTRKKFARLVKEIDPTKRFPDVEAEDLREEMEKKFEDRDRRREVERNTARLEAQKNSLKSRYDEKSIEAIEKLMENKGISDYEDGATLYAATVKPAAPTYETSDHSWKLPQVEIKDFGNLKQRGRSQAYQAIDELNRNRTH